jgi:molybdate transport system ATP-binding protein
MAGELIATFERERPAMTIVADLRVPLEPGVTALFGPSGCGKTTVLRCLAGLDRPRTGVIRFGKETWFERRRCVSPRRRRIGYVSQEESLFPHLSVERNIAYGVRGVRGSERARRVGTAIDLMGVRDWSARRPGELSGGQRQRVALARALAPWPRLVLLDEPLGALDVPARGEVRGLLRRVLSGLGSPAILVTHDRSDVLAIADRVAVMIAGRVRQAGPVEEVFSRPADADVATIVGVETVVEGQVIETRDGLSTVRIGSAELLAVAVPGAIGGVLVCIRPEEVTLKKNDDGKTSARNQLSGRIAAVDPAGMLVRIEIDCGFCLAALVTRPSVEELGLVVGATVTAALKAPAVHLIPH